MASTADCRENEFDEKYVQDLETAQALSLESLALEQFRLEKQRSFVQKSDLPTGEGYFPKIRPPPPVLRRTSVTSQPCSKKTNSSTDLISFQSPFSGHLQNRPPCDTRKETLNVNIPSSSSGNAPAFGNKSRVPCKSANLIDLNDPRSCSRSGKESVRVSLLEAFDPLLTASETCLDNDELDSSEPSIYEVYDPFDYFYSPPSRSSQSSDLVYSAVMKVPNTQKEECPSEKSHSLRKESLKKQEEEAQCPLHQNISPVNNSIDSLCDPDLCHFLQLIKNLRGEFKHSNFSSNIGLIMSSKIDSYYNSGTSVKVVVHSQFAENPVTFTCDVSSSIEHVILHAACELEISEVGNYALRINGQEEYFDSKSLLKDYEYVHQCIKLEKDIVFSLVCLSNLERPLARTAEDDSRSNCLSVENILPNEYVQPISYEAIAILLETFEKELEKVTALCHQLKDNETNLSQAFKPQLVHQAVKAICALLGNIETLQITNALTNFSNSCDNFNRSRFCSKSANRPYLDVLDDDGNYSYVKIGESDDLSRIVSNCNNLRLAVQNLVTMYIRVFRAGFTLKTPSSITAGTWCASEVVDSLLVHVEVIHRIPQNWLHTQFLVGSQIYYGTRPIGQPVFSKAVAASNKSHHNLIIDSWLNFDGITINNLSRECRIVFELHGKSSVEGEDQLEELGWAAIQLFDHDRCFTQGSFLLSVWPPEANKKLGPAPPFGTYPLMNSFPYLGVTIPEYGGEIIFPLITADVETLSWGSSEFSALDENTQHQLLEIIDQDTFSNPVVEDREILWEKRHYLLKHPQALPKVLLAAHSWDYTCLPDLYSMLYSWSPMDPISAFQLLLPCFPDGEVRLLAVQWIDQLSSDQLIDFLPQLVQALKHETYETSSLSKLLLKRSLLSPKFAHNLYWLLVHMLPGEFPQNSSVKTNVAEMNYNETRYHRRMQLMLRSLLAICGEALRSKFMAQQLLMKGLSDAAEYVKSSKESARLNTLWVNLENVHSTLSLNPTFLPINPGLIMCGVNITMCSYFPSNTLPLKIHFTNSEGYDTPAIFKVGDDLQQDMMTLQMIRLMDKMWLKEGIDLKMVTFSCVPTGYKKGMIEMITNSETLRKIQVEFGLTGSFKDRPIAEWLAKHNPSALEYERAVTNFTASCAGYCVATYILGICDRHNDNIMLKNTGHMFHIDFGKFLGDAQMIGNFKRDRTPFVLTSDMAYVINGGEKPSVRFHHFVDLCCQAFNIIRKNGNIILNVFGLMASSGVGGLTVESVRYVQRALLPHLSDAEAAATFAQMIQNTLKSWFTQFNFFIHNLAQLRFSIDQGSNQLLSFVSKTFSMKEEGRLIHVQVYGCQKRYDPEKYYLYILKVERVSQPDPVYIFRSYKEFCELHQKLCILFPLSRCHSLQNPGIQMKRSNTKQVAEKRMIDLQKFLDSLFSMTDEICHSDIVYTFFHPLLRDQQESSINESKLKDKYKDKLNAGSYLIKGQIKLSIQYLRETFRVMVHHVQDLSYVAGYQEPSTYVKVYLLPDPTKATKRKTKVIRRNCHPSFMEMLEYRMPLERVENRLLQATVWSHDSLQENEFLGGTTINLSGLDLGHELTAWYPLRMVHK